MWKNDGYYYGVGTLRAIAHNYKDVYEGILFASGHTILNLWDIAEFKGDFDMSLNAIGRGNWTGDIEDREFKDFRGFGFLQQVVIADIFMVSDDELGALGFYDISKLRKMAYSFMANLLNGKPIHRPKLQEGI